MDKIQEAIYGVVIDYADDVYDLRDLLVILGVFKSIKLEWTKPKRKHHNRNTRALVEIAENARQLEVRRKITENAYQLEILTYKYLTSNSPYLKDMQDKFEKLKDERARLFEAVWDNI
ncbi:MAG: hypothetical protein BWY47_00177 [Bacteroidetes bacterium ADurb.Bin302]|nr:MAG: hypothetical protein BWY47_00177 [Bacteroidetes bacterium ADurb.Bin302]